MYELIYVSAARSLPHAGELGALLERARHRNSSLGVTGILLYESGSFIQVLEGEQGVVAPLFAEIAQDHRHYRVRVVRERAISKRSFAEWSMGFVALDPQLMRALPRRHGLSSNGSLIDDTPGVLEVLDAFRAGQLRSYVLDSEPALRLPDRP